MSTHRDLYHDVKFLFLMMTRRRSAPSIWTIGVCIFILSVGTFIYNNPVVWNIEKDFQETLEKMSESKCDGSSDKRNNDDGSRKSAASDCSIDVGDCEQICMKLCIKVFKKFLKSFQKNILHQEKSIV